MAMLANKNIMKKIEDNVRPILKTRSPPSQAQIEKIKAEYTERLAVDAEFARYVQQMSSVNVESHAADSNTPNETSFINSVEFKQNLKNFAMSEKLAGDRKVNDKK